jgi:hypothetical protein
MLHVCSSDLYGTPYYKALVHGAIGKVCQRPSELLLPFEIWFPGIDVQLICGGRNSVHSVPVTLRSCTSSCAVCGYMLIRTAKCTVFCSEVLHIDWRVTEGTQVCCSLYCIYLHSVCAALHVNTTRLVSSELDVVWKEHITCVEGPRKIKKPFSHDSRLPSLNPERRGSACPLTTTLMSVPSVSGFHSDAVDDSSLLRRFSTSTAK